LRKNFKYRLYLTEAQSIALDQQLAEACRLYNAALQERRDAYRMAGESINYYDQANQLKEIRAQGDLELANFSCCQDVLRRVDKTFNAFFRRVKAGEKAGYPRFKPVNRYDSITFPSYGDGCKLLANGKLRLQGVGAIKVKLHRQLEGEIKTVTIKREAGKWYAVFSVECEAKPLPASDQATGVDVGLAAFATPSDGTEIETPDTLSKPKPNCGEHSAKLRAARLGAITEGKRYESCKKRTLTYAISAKILQTRFPELL